MNFNNENESQATRKIAQWFRTRSLAGRMMLTGLPLLAGSLLLLFAFAGKSVENIIDSANDRNAQLQARALGMQLTNILTETRNQLLLLASGPIEREQMLGRLRNSPADGQLSLREVAFMGVDPEDRYLFVNYNDEIVSVPPASAREVAAGPFQGFSQKHAKGHVNVSRPTEISYPLVPIGGSPQTVAFHGIRFSTPIYDDQNLFIGILSICLDLTALRNQLSLSPLLDETRPGRSFFFDQDGWLLFQSESSRNMHLPLGSDNIREGFRGDFGRPGFSTAFRPAPEHLPYWNMVSDVQAGKSGILSLPVMASALDMENDTAGAVSFTPVFLQANSSDPPVLVGGLGRLDQDFAGSQTGRKLLGIFSLCLAGGIILLAISLWHIARTVSRRISQMTAEINKRNQNDSEEALDLPGLPRELEKMRGGINFLLDRLRGKKGELASQARARNAQWLAEPMPAPPPPQRLDPNDLVGSSAPMQKLIAQIRKAAQADCDILITGETGTGKELVSGSIHRLSRRQDGPFISINCGALDETLLMDTLFGHVKGAFTEAKSPRKGAFLAACGGTLLLDEIGNASPKVQQALLRALSTRQIRPLGSDEDVPFDTRIIAATNLPLHGDAQDFRNDLYYRLAVITIETPPLRQRLEDIQELVLHFMRLSHNTAAELPVMSRGALEKLLTHSWPGNVRELKNVITRAMTFCNGKIIYDQDLALGRCAADDAANELDDLNGLGLPAADEFAPERMASARSGERARRASPETQTTDAFMAANEAGLNANLLNLRLKRLWPHLASLESVSRQEYQELAGKDISARTAQYDLRLLVRLGFMRREGRGPSMRYVPLMPA